MKSSAIIMMLAAGSAVCCLKKFALPEVGPPPFMFMVMLFWIMVLVRTSVNIEGVLLWEL